MIEGAVFCFPPMGYCPYSVQLEPFVNAQLLTEEGRDFPLVHPRAKKVVPEPARGSTPSIPISQVQMKLVPKEKTNG
jgi:hypothetical protein